MRSRNCGVVSERVEAFVVRSYNLAYIRTAAPSPLSCKGEDQGEGSVVCRINHPLKWKIRVLPDGGIFCRGVICALKNVK